MLPGLIRRTRLTPAATDFRKARPRGNLLANSKRAWNSLSDALIASDGLC
jgi:hypothetical protein